MEKEEGERRLRGAVVVGCSALEGYYGQIIGRL